jgi:hypothetical protein
MLKFPIQATWRNSDHDTPVTIIGVYGEMNGVVYYISASGTGLPAHELIFHKRRFDKLRTWLKI